MNQEEWMRLSRTLLLLIALLLVPALACGIGGEDEPTAAPQPTAMVATDVPAATEPPLPTEAPQVEPTAVPTKIALPTPAPVQPAVFELSSTPYAHASGAIDIYPPVGWAADESHGGVSFSAPDDSGYIDIEITNTSLELDGDSFERFVDARDANFFGRSFSGYEVISREIDKNSRVARITKRLTLDGVPQIVFTHYDQFGEIVYSIDFWADADVAAAYQEKYEQILDTTTVDSAAAAQNVDEYYWIFTFTGPSALFEIDVPLPWRYETSSDNTTIVDTFYSPDEHAIIQNLTYDDGTEISRSEAGAFALELLKSFYASDIRITDDQVQSDGSERLTWNSPSGDYSGISFLETRGTTFLLFSVLWDNPYEADYFDALDYTISSYVVP
jgi:hypothetical protein